MRNFGGDGHTFCHPQIRNELATSANGVFPSSVTRTEPDPTTTKTSPSNQWTEPISAPNAISTATMDASSHANVSPIPTAPAIQSTNFQPAATPTISESSNANVAHNSSEPANESNISPATNHCLSHFSLVNIAGLKPQTVPSKVPYIEDLLKDKNQLFVVLTETWLKNHKQAELNIDGYSLYRADRKGRAYTRGRYSGGAAIYLRSDIAATTEKVLSFSNGVVESVVVYSEKENLLICAIYRQPDDSMHNHRSGVAELTQALKEISNVIDTLKGTPDILLCGDFNLPTATWCSTENAPSTPNNALINALNEFQNKHFLTQMVNKPTHKAGNILDLIFTNNQQLINEIHCLPTQFSDHYVVEIASHFKSHFARQHQSQRQFTNVFDSLNFFSEDIDWDQINGDLKNVEWDQVFSGLEAEDKLHCFLLICQSISALHAPQKKDNTKSRHNNIPRDRRLLMRRRRKVTKQLAKYPSGAVRGRLDQELIQIELKLQESYMNLSSAQEQKALAAIRRNPKYFFTYVKKFNKVKPSIGPLLNSSKQYATSNSEMARILSEQYSSVFSTRRDPLVDPALLFNSEDMSKLVDIQFNISDIIEAIDEISSNSAPGPDCFPAILLKQCKEVLATPLVTIWRECLDKGLTPTLLKLSLIVPIHKGDSTAMAKNYRPVALTSHLVKIFEKVIRKHIVKHLEANSSFNPSQHGFRSGRSCLSQLLTHYEMILSQLEEGHNVDVIYLDFAKAFDKLDFNVTLNKLKMLGIDGKIGRWIHSFLTGRHQSVVVNGEKSPPAEVLSGVPQGSVIGPILFLILIGDIDQNVAHAFLSSFADDTRVGKAIKSVADAALLQQDLNQVYQWAALNNMEFNEPKFDLLRYGRNIELKDATSYVTDSNTPIEEKQMTKDLGVIMSNTGDFNDHISKVTETVRDLSSWIL